LAKRVIQEAGCFAGLAAASMQRHFGARRMSQYQCSLSIGIWKQEVLFYSHLEMSIMKQLGKYLSALFLAVTLVSFVGCASTAKKEGTGEYIDDSAITTKVKAAIFNEPSLKSAEVNVETFKGVVQLSGFASSQAAKDKAGAVASHVPGVKSVKNDMRLK
jgi:hyperosmotically inducible protein